jgi:hypothetical protein
MSSSVRRVDGVGRVPSLPRDPSLYVNTTILVYGQRNTGKSKIIEDIVYICKRDIEIGVCISATATKSGSFDGIFPPNCLMGVEEADTFDRFTKLVARQKECAEEYKCSKDMDILLNILNKLQPDERVRQGMKMLLERKNSDSVRTKKESVDNNTYVLRQLDVENTYNSRVRQLVANYVKEKNLSDTALKTMFTDREQNAIRWLNEPLSKMLIVLDDCAHVLKKWVTASPLLKDIFYNGRWYNITIIIAAQEDTEIDVSLRKNAVISFFTNGQTAMGNFEKKANGYTREIRRRAGMIVNSLFIDRRDNDPMKHTKLAYSNYIPGGPFFFFNADLHRPQDTAIGSPELWCKKK